LNSVEETFTPFKAKLEPELPVTVTAPVELPKPRVLPAVVAIVVLPVMLAPPAVTVKPVPAVMVVLAAKAPVTLVASWSSIVPAELSTMLPEVVVVRLRLPEVALRAWLMLVAVRLLRLVLAPPPVVAVLPTTRQKLVAAEPDQS
jgi:hypothetical protein